MTTKSTSSREIRFEGPPANYRIVVQGVLNQDWSDRLGDMTISHTTCGRGSTQTTLSGPVRDQAQLNGVLDTLYSMHLPILKVERVEEEESMSTSLPKKQD